MKWTQLADAEKRITVLESQLAAAQARITELVAAGDRKNNVIGGWRDECAEHADARATAEKRIAELEAERREAVYDMMLAQERTAFLESLLAGFREQFAAYEAAADGVMELTVKIVADGVGMPTQEFNHLATECDRAITQRDVLSAAIRAALAGAEPAGSE